MTLGELRGIWRDRLAKHLAEGGTWENQEVSGDYLVMHPSEPALSDDAVLIPHGGDWVTQAFHKRAARLFTKRGSRTPEESSLRHPVRGHMNKHRLKMKWKRRAEGEYYDWVWY